MSGDQTRCNECGTSRSHGGGFTQLSSEKSGSTRLLCPSCWNDYMAHRMGIEPPELSDLKPVRILNRDGIPHTFEFEVRLSTGLGVVAYEIFNGERTGYEFSVFEHPKTTLREAYSKLIARITAGLSVKYLEIKDQHRNYRWGPTSIVGSAVNGRFEERCDGETGEEQLGVVVDGRFLTFEEFGRSLSSYVGFNFRIECVDASDALDISANPERPDPVPWLQR